MSEYTVTYDSCMEAARLASSRGDRLGAEQALMAAIAAAGAPGSEALVAAPLMKLGELKRDAGSLAEAEEMFGRALEIAEMLDGDDGVSLVAALTSLASVRAVRGAPEEAEKHLNRALSLSERRLGREHPDLVVLLNDLSRLYLKRSAFALAEPLLHRLHAIKRQKGEEHAEVATVLASLATVRQALGDHDTAEQLWRRVLTIRERTLAPNHFAIATAVESLAETCSARGKVGEALRLFHRALAMREMTLGPSHPSLRTLRERIADLQLQGSDGFSDEEAFPSPLTSIPPTDIASNRAPAVKRIASTTDNAVASAPAPMSSAVLAEHEVRMQAVREIAALHAGQATPVQQGAPAAAASTPVVYAQPAAPELEVPAWSMVAQAAPAAALTRTAQPMSIILPAPSDGRFDDDEADDVDDGLAFAQTRMQRMSSSLGGIFTRRQTQLVAGGVFAIALVVVAVARSQPGPGSDQATAAPRAPAREYVAAGTAVLGDSGVASTADSVGISAASSPAANREASAPTPPAERTRNESSPAVRTPAKAAVVPAAPEPTLPLLPSASALTGISSAQLDAAMSAAAPERVSLGTPIEKPGFGGRIGAVDYSERATTKPPLLIGAIPKIPYPQALRVTGRETGGEVVVEFTVDTLGVPNLSTLRFVRSDHELLAAAVSRAIPAMRFVPAVSNGKKAVAKVQLPFTFAPGRE